MARLFSDNRLQQRLRLADFSLAEPNAGQIHLSLDVTRLELENVIQICSGLVGLSRGERKLCELAQTKRSRSNVMVFRRGKIARRQGRLSRLIFRLEGFSRIIGCSTCGKKRRRERSNHHQACRDALQEAIQRDTRLRTEAMGSCLEFLQGPLPAPTKARPLNERRSPLRAPKRKAAAAFSPGSLSLQ